MPLSTDELMDRLRSAVGTDAGLGTKSIKIKTDDASIFINGADNSVSNTDTEADATIKLTVEVLEELLDGKIAAIPAFMQGKLKVEGDQGTAVKIQNILAKAR